MGVTIRHWFNMGHARQGRPWWTIPATGGIFAVIVWLAWPGEIEPVETAAVEPAARATVLAQAAGFEEVTDIVLGHCAMCHAAEPGWGSLAVAPKGVMLETPAQIAHHAREIWLQAGVSHAMPPGVANYMGDEARAAIRTWYEGAGL
jgi:uncharacterized membrane protein